MLESGGHTFQMRTRALMNQLLIWITSKFKAWEQRGEGAVLSRITSNTWVHYALGDVGLHVG